MGDRLKRFGKGIGEFVNLVDEAASAAHQENWAKREREMTPQDRLDRAIDHLREMYVLPNEKDEKIYILTQLRKVSEGLNTQTTTSENRPWPTPVANPPRCSMSSPLSDCLDRDCFHHSTAKRRWERNHFG